jgi:glycosyltransferase involved in cell wall biosynthesis
MKVSIITVCFNSEKTIEDTLKSVTSQTYPDIEYIVVDGLSKDGTNEIVQRYSDIVSVHVSEKDNGLYDAMNKGIQLATGDVIGILNSDDIFFNEIIIQEVVDNIQNIDCVYADIGFYKEHDLGKKVRHYSSNGFSFRKLSRGIMPAHPSVYVRSECYAQAGFYNVDYEIASDFDMVVKLFNLPNFKSRYIPIEFVKMRMGGVSTGGFKANIQLNKEILQSCRENNIKSSWFRLLSKYPKKILGYIFK